MEADGRILLRDVTVRYGRRIALEAVSGERLDASLGKVERLLVMAGDDAGGPGPLAEAIETLRAVRTDLASPTIAPPSQR